MVQTLQRTNWNKQEAAHILGLYRPTLYSKLRKHNIEDPGRVARAAREARTDEQRLPFASGSGGNVNERNVLIAGSVSSAPWSVAVELSVLHRRGARWREEAEGNFSGLVQEAERLLSAADQVPTECRRAPWQRQDRMASTGLTWSRPADERPAADASAPVVSDDVAQRARRSPAADGPGGMARRG